MDRKDPLRQLSPAPPRSAPLAVKQAWCENAVALALRFIRPEGPPAPDARDTHSWEVEFQSALLDPPAYERYLRERVEASLMAPA